MKTVNILGTEYKMITADVEDDPKLEECNGYVDPSVKKIVIAKFETCPMSIQDLDGYTRKVMRHEITHAFLYESGLWDNSSNIEHWGQSEEITDWIALQFPKMLKAFQEVGALEVDGTKGDEPMNNNHYRWWESVETVPCSKNKEAPTEAKIENALRALEKLNEELEHKVYIVVSDTGEYEDRTVTVERVYSTREKAREYIKEMGYTLLTPWGDYCDPDELRRVRLVAPNQPEWKKKLMDYSERYPERSDEYIRYWGKTIAHDTNEVYRIEEHDIDQVTPKSKVFS